MSSYLFDILAVGEGNTSGAGSAYGSFLGNISEEAIAQALALVGFVFCFVFKIGSHYLAPAVLDLPM